MPLHPFREGNGRSQREFIRCLALINDTELAFKLEDKDEMFMASVESFELKYDRMEALIRKRLIPLPTDQKGRWRKKLLIA